MENWQIKSIYDRLCFALTDYENHAEDGEHDDYHDGEALYGKIADIVSDMAERM